VSGGRAELRARRAQLVARAAVERDEIAHDLGAWSGVLAKADRVLGALSFVRRMTPVLGIGFGLAGAMAGRPKTAGGWIQAAMGAWRAIRWVGLLTLVLIPACGTQTTRSVVGTLEVKAAIDSLWTGYAHASDRKDTAAFGALLTEDATLVYSGRPTAQGREEIQTVLASIYAGIDPTGLRIEPDETRVSGLIAVQSGTFQDSFNDKGISKTDYGRFVLVAESEDNRTWKIRRLVRIDDSTRATP
jgi:uncharacterized protein (TIGR02246 family)